MSNTDIKTIFITGGGTGGHIYPAVSIINELQKNNESKIYYIGNKKNLECSICKDLKLNFLSVPISGMPRKMSFKFFIWCLQTLYSALIASFYVIKHKPDVVFATGGYVSAPALIAANIFKIPYVLHDCDARPGIVSRVFAKNAKAVSVAFEDAKNYLKSKNVIYNGNPIRETFINTSKNEARKILEIDNKFCVLIMGGSQGAKTLNDAALGVMEHFKNSNDINIILQTGKKNFDKTKNTIEKRMGAIPKNIIVRPYFDNLAIPLCACDAVVSRAGSLSISEICAAGVPSVLVPYPYAAANHQYHNAMRMVDLEASVYLRDEMCTGEQLCKFIEMLKSDSDLYEKMKKNTSNLSSPHAATNIVLLIKEAMK